MRSSIVTSPKGLEVRGIAGTFVVLLAFNCPKSYCQGLLGFGIQRKDHENGEVLWLRGLKKFDLPNSDDGGDVSTRHHPIQKFHWGDYATKPGRAYTYTIHALTGQPGSLVDIEAIELDVTCELPERVGQHGHAVHFNRGAAASQAFASRFPHLPAGDVEDPNARTWLSRGLAESLIAFINAANLGEGLHLFLYEFEKDDFFDALQKAGARGVKLEILYDALLDKDGQGPSLKSKPKIKQFGLEAVCKDRSGSGLNISHNKFMALTDAAGKAKAVWTGSTNFTDGAIYGQSNVGHAVFDSALAQIYLNWHQAIWNAPNTSAAHSREIAMKSTTVPTAEWSGPSLVLSPRRTIEAVTECAQLVSKGQRLVCFTAPFALHDELEEALTNAPAHVLGLLNKDNVVGKALHQAPNTQLASAGSINEKSILEAWQGKLQAESMHHSGVYVHTKILLVDPLSQHPIVITGSANFSTNSSKNNDENQLFIAGESEVADVYLGEFMRMFDHYYFRDHSEWIAAERQTNPKAGFLDATDGWTDRFFDGREREALRLAFFG